MALLDEPRPTIAVVTPRLPRRHVSLGRRACIRRRSGSSARSATCSGSSRPALPDTRPWLDHRLLGRDASARRPRRSAGERAAYAFLPVEGEGLHQIPVGPVHAGIIEPGHFRFTANGETVVRLEQRLGYVHKGIEALMTGADARQGAQARRPHLGRQHGRLCARLRAAPSRRRSASSAPPRAVWLRALMAELERSPIISATSARSATTPPSRSCTPHCGILRERVLRAADACFGHRLMMDRIVPGGVAADLAPTARARHRAR